MEEEKVQNIFNENLSDKKRKEYILKVFKLYIETVLNSNI